MISIYDPARGRATTFRYAVGTFCVLGPRCIHKGSGSVSLTNHCIHLYVVPLSLTSEEIEDIGRFLGGPMAVNATDIADWLVRGAPPHTNWICQANEDPPYSMLQAKSEQSDGDVPFPLPGHERGSPISPDADAEAAKPGNSQADAILLGDDDPPVGSDAPTGQQERGPEREPQPYNQDPEKQVCYFTFLRMSWPVRYL